MGTAEADLTGGVKSKRQTVRRWTERNLPWRGRWPNWSCMVPTTAHPAFPEFSTDKSCTTSARLIFFGFHRVGKLCCQVDKKLVTHHAKKGMPGNDSATTDLACILKKSWIIFFYCRCSTSCLTKPTAPFAVLSPQPKQFPRNSSFAW